MGRMQKNKGKVFERKIATALRRRFPAMTVRRSLQAHKPYEPDVVVEGVPIWWECSDTREPNPPKKMKQAERDVEKARAKGFDYLIPVVVWHSLAKRRVWVSIRLHSLMRVIGEDSLGLDNNPLLTLELGEFLDLPLVVLPLRSPR